MGFLFQKMEDENFFEFEGEGVNDVSDLAGNFLGDDGLVEVEGVFQDGGEGLGFINVLVKGENLGFGLGFAPVGDGFISGDVINPGGEFLGGVKGVEVFKNFDEDVLEDVFCCGLVNSGESVNESEEGLLPSVNEAIKPLLVLEGEFDKFNVRFVLAVWHGG